MSAIAVNPMDRAARFYAAPIGKKAVMAVTGLMLVGYVVAHLLGNLQIYSSNHEQINAYAGFLHNPNNALALWAARGAAGGDSAHYRVGAAVFPKPRRASRRLLQKG
jgi:succinate dehydrogenase / fumarate reductase cytochrome b subunit